MSALLAIVVDSWHQARDKKILVVLSLLSAVVVLFCASLSFERRDPLATLEEQVAQLGELAAQGQRHAVRSTVPAACDAGAARREPGGAFSITIEFRSGREIDRFVGGWNDFKNRRTVTGSSRRGEASATSAATEASYPAEARQKALEERFADLGYEQVRAESLDAEAKRFAVRVVPGRGGLELRGGVTTSFLFGLVKGREQSLSEAEIVVMTELGIADGLCGKLGMLIALLVTCSFVPDLLQKGTLDLVLARPIGRAALLLAKFAGGIWFVAAFTTLTVGGAWLALGARTGHWAPHFLLTIVTTSAQFAVLYSVAVLVGVWSRSSGLSALAAIGTWMLSGAIASVRQLSHAGGIVKLPSLLERGLEVVYWVVPKTSDVGAMNQQALAQAWLSPEARARIGLAGLPHVDYALSLGTTVAFAALMLGVACWLFRRRDW